ncbi:ammonium transporter Rh type A-like [Gigantopelta aegis]|uniref:ammonium transporter Rh type A-like n=1 Tax=Gigantopelta aegis TaxID=1735272 RepID=UPI001B88AAB2|nr:ammonium transporter Rh type A-like [Gigantopelta aegis]
MASLVFNRLRFPLLLLFLQIVFIVLFAMSVDYDESARPVVESKDGHNDTKPAAEPIHQPLPEYYPMFQDVHVMIFIGFGFLMTFLKRYGFSAVGLNLLLAAVAIQWATLVGGFFHGHGGTVHISITSMLTADFASAAVLITYGALLGKTSPTQLVIVTIIEIILFSFNEYIGVTMFQAVDIGGSMFVHAFGAYFGLSMSRVLYREDVARSKKEGSVYHSDIFSMIGTVFLWMFWPSFNSALAPGDDQHRAVLNTYFALAACCVVTFAISSLVDKHGKFDMVHIQNATLAGGVAVGTSADMMIGPFGALIIGSLAAILSVIGYKYISPWMNAKLKIHDTCGVHNLHGMPAIMAGIAGAGGAFLASTEQYGYSLYEQFPARVPTVNSTGLAEIMSHVNVEPGLGRSAMGQAGYQLVALAVTLAIAIVGGVLTGFILKYIPGLGRPMGDNLFEDSATWEIPEEDIPAAMLELETSFRRANVLQESGRPLLHKHEKDGASMP